MRFPEVIKGQFADAVDAYRGGGRRLQVALYAAFAVWIVGEVLMKVTPAKELRYSLVLDWFFHHAIKAQGYAWVDATKNVFLLAVSLVCLGLGKQHATEEGSGPFALRGRALKAGQVGELLLALAVVTAMDIGLVYLRVHVQRFEGELADWGLAIIYLLRINLPLVVFAWVTGALLSGTRMRISLANMCTLFACCWLVNELTYELTVLLFHLVLKPLAGLLGETDGGHFAQKMVGACFIACMIPAYASAFTFLSRVRGRAAVIPADAA